jgi:hypothetical protein
LEVKENVFQRPRRENKSEGKTKEERSGLQE